MCFVKIAILLCGIVSNFNRVESDFYSKEDCVLIYEYWLYCSCQPGYTGILCNQPCRKNTFGKNCRKKCDCSGNPCDHINGACINPPITESVFNDNFPTRIIVGFGTCILCMSLSGLVVCTYFLIRKKCSIFSKSARCQQENIEREYEEVSYVPDTEHHTVEYFETYEVPCHVGDQSRTTSIV